MPLYCDEAGNTGSNYVDADQPIHVLAGWLVPAEAAAAYDAACEAFASRRPGQGERKAARLIRSAPGRRSIATFFDAALSGGAHPICVITEKKYCVCLKVIDTFLDPAHNERASWLPIDADVARRDLADWMLSALPDSVLHAFATAYRAPTSAAFDAAIRAVASACRYAGRPGVGVAIEGNLAELDDLVEREAAPALHVPQHLAKSINVFTFGSFVQQASSFVESLGIEPPDLIHDDSKEFREALDALMSFYRAASGAPPMPLESGRLYFGGIDHIRGFEMRASDSDIALQGADALATLVKELSLNILQREEPQSALAPILRQLRRRVHAYPHALFWMASTKFTERWLDMRSRLPP